MYSSRDSSYRRDGVAVTTEEAAKECNGSRQKFLGGGGELLLWAKLRIDLVQNLIFLITYNNS